jgi:hypothetical protein
MNKYYSNDRLLFESKDAVKKLRMREDPFFINICEADHQQLACELDDYLTNI